MRFWAARVCTPLTLRPLKMSHLRRETSHDPHNDFPPPYFLIVAKVCVYYSATYTINVTQLGKTRSAEVLGGELPHAPLYSHLLAQLLQGRGDNNANNRTRTDTVLHIGVYSHSIKLCSLAIRCWATQRLFQRQSSLTSRV